jgi:hypothetical protein
MINIKLLLAIVVIYSVLFLLFGFLINKIAIFISHKINNVDMNGLENYELDMGFKISIIFFMIINIFALYYFIKKHKVSILEIYIFGFITWLLFTIIYSIIYIVELKYKFNSIDKKITKYSYLIFATLMMFLNGAIYAIIAKLAYYYKLAE